MKYIKLFEEANDLYWEIPREEFEYVMPGDDPDWNEDESVLNFEREDFSKKESLLLKQLGFKIIYDLCVILLPFTSGKKSTISLRLYKSSDSWYYAETDLNVYKCDQFDGLIECLKKEFNIKTKYIRESSTDTSVYNMP